MPFPSQVPDVDVDLDHATLGHFLLAKNQAITSLNPVGHFDPPPRTATTSDHQLHPTPRFPGVDQAEFDQPGWTLECLGRQPSPSRYLPGCWPKMEFSGLLAPLASEVPWPNTQALLAMCPTPQERGRIWVHWSANPGRHPPRHGSASPGSGWSGWVSLRGWNPLEV